ncbi:calcium/calmodulin-dependent protein kinase [Histoplasma capsulatum G186AR]|uniref:Serine/threonine-protein kinase ATG1 n=1 Tax=Ajellomyces capsulatus TaxID=5037 RepID=A0A8H7YQU8_AJECA|nr:calcium/calmodulin-dependent protein kinase [Histoplasma capsulatum]QSS73507.1 calcium/calmodulin-dependent protein kinase [Histoplasma capsulatum G186AR]
MRKRHFILTESPAMASTIESPALLTAPNIDQDPNIILIIEAEPRTHGAEALVLTHNRARYFPPDEFSQPGSREHTPSPEPEGSKTFWTKKYHHLCLTFDKPPKNAGRGFSFGSDKAVCDVLLAPNRTCHHISRVHFYITFDEQGRLILKDESTYGTALSYDGWGGALRRRRFQWILFPEFTIQIHLPNFALDIVQLKSRSCYLEYQRNLTKFLDNSHDAVLALAGLDVQSYGSGSTDHLTDPYSPGQQPIYFPRAVLGQGGFGKVFLVSHLSNGMVYAAKELLKGSSLRNEAAILRNISHKHVVQYVDFTEVPTTQLIMEYLPLGNLDDQHKKSPITESEARKLLLQGLDALQYLHSRKNPITHRDIKPENILVLGRGANFHIKLSDFGPSKDIPLLKTNCGTPSYKPPEIFRVYKQRKSEKDPQKRASLLYDNKVDVWALGVVVLQYIVDLTDEELPWYEQITRTVKDMLQHRPDDPFIALLSKMLRMNPSTRPSSENCFQEATRTGMASPGDLKEDKTSNDDNTSDPITAEVLKPELASPNVPTPIVSGTNRVPGAKRDPSPTGPSGHRTKRPRINQISLTNRPYYSMAMEILNELHLRGALIEIERNDQEILSAVELICEEFSRQKITNIDITYSVESQGVIIKACRADRSGEFVLGHFTSMAPFTSPMELAYQLIIQNSEKEEITSPVDMKTRSKWPASHKSSTPSIR